MTLLNKAYRAVTLTLNNPPKYHLWARDFDHTKASKEEFEQILRASLDPFIVGRNGRVRDPSKNGAIATFELSKNNTPHIQLYLSSSSPIKFSSLQKSYPHTHIEPVRGTSREITDYLFKRGKFVDKADTQLCEPVVWGSYFIDNKGSAESPPLFEEIDELLSQGLKPRDIYELGAKYAYYRGAIETAYAALKASEIPHKRDITVYYHVGLAGTGKSHEYWEICKKHSKEQVYFINGEYRNAWDFYDYEPIVFLDDMRGTSMSLTALLALLDEYPTLLRCRYADRQLAATEFHLTSVIPPERLYAFYDHESFEQLKRRIDYVVYHWKDDNLQGNERYKKLVVPSSEYENYQQLIRLTT